MTDLREQTQALWKRCFTDSDAFTDMYFRLRYTEKRNVAIEEGGQVVSALQMLPYPMSFYGQTVDTSYVSGACTHPDFRNRGLMRRLLTQAFHRMWKAGVCFSTLIPAEPWLFDYYASTGYAPVFELSERETILTGEAYALSDISFERITEYRAEVYAYLCRKLAARPCCILHTEEDFRVILADLGISDGILLVARQQVAVKGLLVAYREEGKCVVNELLAEDEEIERGLLQELARCTGCKQMLHLLPPTVGMPHRSLGMARVIHAEKVLRLYAAARPQETLQLSLTDNELPANNGFYRLAGGECTYSANPLPGSYRSLTPCELTALLFQDAPGYMSLMMN